MQSLFAEGVSLSWQGPLLCFRQKCRTKHEALRENLESAESLLSEMLRASASNFIAGACVLGGN